MDASFLDISLWASTKSNKDTIKIIQFSLNKYRHGYYANSNCLLYNNWTPCSFWAAGLNEAYVSVEISKTLICGRRKACGPDVDERPCGKLRGVTQQWRTQIARVFLVGSTWRGTRRLCAWACVCVCVCEISPSGLTTVTECLFRRSLFQRGPFALIVMEAVFETGDGTETREKNDNVSRRAANKAKLGKKTNTADDPLECLWRTWEDDLINHFSSADVQSFRR